MQTAFGFPARHLASRPALPRRRIDRAEAGRKAEAATADVFIAKPDVLAKRRHVLVAEGDALIKKEDVLVAEGDALVRVYVKVTGVTSSLTAADYSYSAVLSRIVQ